MNDKNTKKTLRLANSKPMGLTVLAGMRRRVVPNGTTLIVRQGYIIRGLKKWQCFQKQTLEQTLIHIFLRENKWLL